MGAQGGEGTAGRAAADAFVERWSSDGELTTAQNSVAELRELLGVEPLHLASDQDYMFERPVTSRHGDGHTSAGRIDCYRRGHSVPGAKKQRVGTHTRSFDEGLPRTHGEAESYACALPTEEGQTPFADVGEVAELYSELPRKRATYVPFPTSRRHRLALDDLRRDKVGERLRLVRADPPRSDPARVNAEDTCGTSGPLAQVDSLSQDLCPRVRVSRCDRSTSHFSRRSHQP